MARARRGPTKRATSGGVDALVADARVLAGWLRDDAGLVLSPVTLEEGAPDHVRALWQAVGWSDAFLELELARPERALGEVAIAATLSEWASDDGARLSRARLPERLRLVRHDAAGVGLLVADETGDDADPHLVAVVRDTGKVLRQKERYVSFVATRLLERALSGRYRTKVQLVLAREPTPGPPILPTLAPALRPIGDDVLLLDRKDTRGETTWTLSYPGFRALASFLASLEGARLGPLVAGLTIRRPAALVSKVLAAVVPVQTFVSLGAPRSKRTLGKLDGHWMLIDPGGVEGSITIDPADRGCFDVLARLGAPLRLEGAPMLVRHPRPTGPAPGAEANARAGEVLAAILGELAPEHAIAREPLDASDVPSRLRTLLEAVGTSPIVAPVVPPSLEASRSKLRAILERWLAAPYPRDAWEHRSGRDVLASLPARVRFVAHVGPLPHHLLGGEELYYTDETIGLDDPPVLGRSAAALAPQVVHPRLSHFVIDRLLAVVSPRERRAPTWLDLSSTALARPLGEVFPELVRVAPGIYGTGGQLRFASDRVLGAWLAAAAIETLVRVGEPDGYLRARVSGAKLRPDALDGHGGFRAYEPVTGSRGQRHAFGRIDAAPIWIRQVVRSRELPEIRFARADEPQVRAWAASRGGEVGLAR